jgi:ribulose-phosphate 3-epimerase
LLLCDFGDLKGELARLSEAGAQVLHLDVMDGHFVPNLTYGMPIVEGIRRHSDLPLDVHLMISEPLRYAGPMVEAGADLVTFHAEAVGRDVVAEVAGRIRDLGVGVGAAINPGTSLEIIEPCLEALDLVLVMSVDAGFGGQSFNPVALDKLRTLRQRSPDLLLEIDGGINAETIRAARQSGCDLFVVGSAIFNQDDYGRAIAALRSAIDDGAAEAPPARDVSRGEGSR